MEQSLIQRAPYFDPKGLRDELTALARELSGRESELRARVLARLKEVVAQSRGAARRQLESDGNGRRCAKGLSQLQDELIRVIYDFTVYHVYRATNPSAAERMSIVATGGYGRGMLAPGSDIDLLFLLPYKQTAWGESVVEYILYVLWDLGFKVGHATRSVDQCMRLSQSDMTIRTSLLDARLLWGDLQLFEEFERRFLKDVVKGSGREFIEAKLAERDQRHAHQGASRYLVEPNVKDGKGGLRDLHTLHWLASYLHPEEREEDFVKLGVFSKAEQRTFRKCGDFLWTVRCHLHFLTGRAEERLSFDVQPIMAERLNYRDGAGLRAVERFMKHYFLVAKDVGDLTRIVCSALEVKQLKTVPALNELLAPSNWRKRVRLRKTSDFRIDTGRINVARDDVFQTDPVNLIRLFWLADRHNVAFHPEAIRLLRASLNLIDKRLREDREANRLFLELLTGSTNPEISLRRMNEAGVLGRFVPAFGRVVSMMQFNMYHHYTVDEHLIRSVGILADIESGKAEKEVPLASEVVRTIDNRRALYVAMFLHDIAKGRDEDHSIVGARIARKFCPRLGLTNAETETVAWLVEHHLVMSLFAQSRDLNDPKTIEDFAETVQSRERLKLLLVLTVADIKAVGPGVWNGWKGQLLNTLYYESEPLLAGGVTALSRTERVHQAEEALRAELADWKVADVDRFIARHYPAYWLRTDPQSQAGHARMIAAAETEGRTFMTRVTSDEVADVTELTVFTPSHPRLISMIAGACARTGANIVSAQISTTRDGMALDTIRLQREFERSDDELRRGERIAKSIGKLLAGDMHLDAIAEQSKPLKRRMRAFTVEPQVIIDNTLSGELTVIEVNGLDRPGLLFELTREMSDLKLDISSAQIATFGEKAVDVFYVTDLIGKKITNAARQRAIRTRMTKILAPETEDEEEEALAV